MRALKALVIFMGILIVVGIGFLIYGLITKLGNVPVTGQERVVSLMPDTSGGRLNISVPQGSRFEQMEIADSRIVLRFATQDAQVLVFIDAVTGSVVGPMTINTEGGKVQE